MPPELSLPTEMPIPIRNLDSVEDNVSTAHTYTIMTKTLNEYAYVLYRTVTF